MDYLFLRELGNTIVSLYIGCLLIVVVQALYVNMDNFLKELFPLAHDSAPEVRKLVSQSGAQDCTCLESCVIMFAFTYVARSSCACF